MTRILGIETSCDETAAAVIEKSGNDTKILSNVVLSQIADHAAFGGVVQLHRNPNACRLRVRGHLLHQRHVPLLVVFSDPKID